MNTEQAFELLPLVSTIIEKTELVDYASSFNGVGQKEGIKILNHVVSNIAVCKAEVFELISRTTGKTVKEVSEQSAVQTFNELKKLFLDTELMDFFKQAM